MEPIFRVTEGDEKISADRLRSERERSKLMTKGDFAKFVGIVAAIGAAIAVLFYAISGLCFDHC